MGDRWRDRPLVIVGAARSGTKFVRDVMAAGPSTAVVPFDVNYVWRMGNPLPHDELGPELATPEVRRRILRSLDRFAEDEPALVEKTVSTALRVPFVDTVLPRARYVHLVRDGWDVIESVRRQWLSNPKAGDLLAKLRSFPLSELRGYGFSYARDAVKRKTQGERAVVTWGPRYEGIDADVRRLSTIEVCAKQWARCVELASSALADIPAERVLTLRYEDVVDDAPAAIRAALALVDLEPDPEHLAKARSMVQTGNAGHGRERLSADEIALVEPILEPARALVGYTQ